MIRPPIFVDARGDLLAFNSVAAALAFLTPATVRERGLQVAYDAEGRLLRIHARQEERRILGIFPRVREWVELVPSEHIPTHEQALRTLLLRFVRPPALDPERQPLRPLEGLVQVGARP